MLTMVGMVRGRERRIYTHTIFGLKNSDRTFVQTLEEATNIDF